MSALIVKRIEDPVALETIQREWNDLLCGSETKTVELTYEWQMTYWQHFSENAELFILIINDGEEIVAIAPLKRTVFGVLGIKMHRLELIAAQESNYQDLVIGKNTNDVLESILEYLQNNQNSWDVLSLRHIPETSHTTHFFLSEEFVRYPYWKMSEKEQCTFLRIETGWEEHKKSLGKDRRHRMKNRMTRIEHDVGPLQLNTVQNSVQLKSKMEEFFDLHQRRWNQTETPSQFMDDRYCRFYSDAGLQLFPKGQLGLAVLEAGKATLAQLLYFTFDKSSLIQMIAYDPAYYPYSPMLVLQEMFVEQSLANGIEVVDWGTYYPWKELWANRIKTRINLGIFPKRMRPGFLYLFLILYESLRIKLKQNPFIRNIVKGLRGKGGWLKRYSHLDAE